MLVRIPLAHLAVTGIACLAASSCTAVGPGPGTAGKDGGRPLVGAIRWDCWHNPLSGQSNGRPGGPVMCMLKSLAPERYHWRLPFFATVVSDHEIRIDGYTQEVVDREIDFARAGGLDYWAFLLYDESSPMSDALKLYLSSSKKREMPFCVITSPPTFGNAQQFRDRMQRVVRLVSEPSYQLVLGGRPLVYVFHIGDEWMKCWGGEENARQLFADLRGAIRATGREDPYLVVMDFSAQKGAQLAKAVGADAVSSYAAAGSGGNQSSYHDLERAAAGFWEQCFNTGTEVVPLAMAGWDRRPRIEHPVTWEKNQKPGVGMERYYDLPTPAELAGHIQDAMSWAVENRAQCPAQTVIVYAWNEHDEGGFLCPTLNPDGSANASRLAAVSAMLREYKPPCEAGAAVPDLPRDGLLLWLDAADSTAVTVEEGKVIRWQDKSGLGNDATAVNSDMARCACADGQEAIRFSGGGGHFRIPTLKNDGQMTVFTVTRRLPDSLAGKYGRVLSYCDGQTQHKGAPADWVRPSWCVATMREEPYDTKVTTTTAQQVNGLCVGMNMSNNGEFFTGDICEIVIYSRAMDSVELRNVHAWLSRKWAVGQAR